MRISRLLLTALLLLALALMLVGCGGGSTTGTTSTPAAGGGGSTGGTTVTESGFAFDPPTLTVKVGDTVTFANKDSAPHNVKIDGKELGTQDPGKDVTWTAAKAGTYPYSCTIHPTMTGEIIVQ